MRRCLVATRDGRLLIVGLEVQGLAGVLQSRNIWYFRTSDSENSVDKVNK